MLIFRMRFLGPFLLSIIVLFVSSSLQAQGNLKIGYLMDSLKVERWQTDLDKFQTRVGELGGTVIVKTSEGDDELQLKQAQELLDSGVKALVLVPHDTEKARRIVEAASARHVPVLCYERLVRDPNVTLFVGVDADAVGYQQANALVQLAPKGNYVLIGGSETDNNAKILHDAQMRVLQPLIARGDVTIVSDTWSKDWNPSEAYAHMAEAIDKAHGNITAVVASNDGTAGGAIQALQDHQLAGKVLVSGQDADLAAIIRILDGTQTMTIYKPVGAQAKLAANEAMELAKGAAVKTTLTVPVGEKSVPAILLDPVTVTKTNVKQTVIKDGFQNLQTIQKSLPKEKWPQ